MEPVSQQPQPAAPKQDPIASIESGASKFDSFGRVIFFIILVEAILIIGLNFYQKSRVNAYNTRLAELKTELNSPNYRALNNQVEQVIAGSDKLSQLLESKVKWGQFYNLLNQVTPKNVRVTSVSISEGGAVKIDGETTSLTSLAKTIVAWSNGTANITSPFSSITLASNGYAEDSDGRKVVFSASGQVNIGALNQ